MTSNLLYGLGGPSTGWLHSWKDRRQEIPKTYLESVVWDASVELSADSMSCVVSLYNTGWLVSTGHRLCGCPHVMYTSLSLPVVWILVCVYLLCCVEMLHYPVQCSAKLTVSPLPVHSQPWFTENELTRRGLEWLQWLQGPVGCGFPGHGFIWGVFVFVVAHRRPGLISQSP